MGSLFRYRHVPRRSRLLTGTVVLGVGLATGASGVATAAPAVPAAPSASRVTPGKYAGTTSQGQSIRFKLVSSTCASGRAPHQQHKAICFVGVPVGLGIYYPTVVMQCLDGSMTSDPLFASGAQISLSPTGQFASTVRGLGSSAPGLSNVSKLTFKASGSKVTGTLRQTESYDPGTGARAVTCDSHTVTFTAKRLH